MRWGVLLLLLDQLAEAKIREAAERGELRNLPGEGKPLDLTDDPFVDPSLAAINRVLKNAGFLPPRIQQLADLEAAMQQLDATTCAATRRRRMQSLRLQLQHLNEHQSALIYASWLRSWKKRLDQHGEDLPT